MIENTIDYIALILIGLVCFASGVFAIHSIFREAHNDKVENERQREARNRYGQLSDSMKGYIRGNVYPYVEHESKLAYFRLIMGYMIVLAYIGVCIYALVLYKFDYVIFMLPGLVIVVTLVMPGPNNKYYRCLNKALHNGNYYVINGQVVNGGAQYRPLTMERGLTGCQDFTPYLQIKAGDMVYEPLFFNYRVMDENVRALLDQNIPGFWDVQKIGNYIKPLIQRTVLCIGFDCGKKCEQMFVIM